MKKKVLRMIGILSAVMLLAGCVRPAGDSQVVPDAGKDGS